MLYFSVFEIKIPSAKSAENRKNLQGVLPTLSEEMPTVSPFYEHVLLQQDEDYKQAGSSVGRQYGTKH